MLWLERFRRARAAGRFIESDLEAAGDWNTCAVGEAGITGPTDAKLMDLMDLGTRFHTAVALNDIAEAEELAEKINARVEFLRIRKRAQKHAETQASRHA